jgi:hypothetical protein
VTLTADQRTANAFFWGVGATTVTFIVASLFTLVIEAGLPRSAMDWLFAIGFGIVPGLCVGTLTGALASIVDARLSKGIIGVSSSISAICFGLVLREWINMIGSC